MLRITLRERDYRALVAGKVARVDAFPERSPGTNPIECEVCLEDIGALGMLDAIMAAAGASLADIPGQERGRRP